MNYFKLSFLKVLKDVWQYMASTNLTLETEILKNAKKGKSYTNLFLRKLSTYAFLWGGGDGRSS